MPLHTRRLPHWTPEGKPLFLTWHLYASLPHNRFPPGRVLSAGKAFVSMDRYLDEARTGQNWLKREQVAAIVDDSIRHAADRLHYHELHAYVIMPNHVHLLVPLIEPSRLMKSIKGFTAREANRVLGQSGQQFWQRESYDHWFRNPAEFERIRHFIENNPVRACLAARPEDYRWSSAWTGNAGRNAGVAGRRPTPQVN